MDDKDDINRLYDLEYGDGPELIARFAGVFGGAVLLFLYTGWSAALLWGGGFAVSHLAYFLFLKSRIRSDPNCITSRDSRVASTLFLLVLASFLWMPTVLICQPDQALAVVGAALVGCILFFLVRRSDTSRFMVAGQIAVVGVTLLAVITILVPRFDNALAQIGVVASFLALLGYFAHAVRLARRQRLTAEDSARRASQVQKLAAVGQLAGGVAHDFNNKLTAILGSFELLREIDDPDEREAILNTGHMAALEAARTVKHLLVYARKEPMVPVLLNCATLLDEVILRTRGIVTGMIEVDVRRTRDALFVLADRNQLLMGLTNLVVNAVDAMPDGGTLVLGAETITPEKPVALADGTFLATVPHVALIVEDTGSGIPARLLPQVVEPFFTTKPVGKGTGLGLSVVMGMAREFGGGLGITSSPKGTRVVIYLPHRTSENATFAEGDRPHR